jgi:hypothetical protein
MDISQDSQISASQELSLDCRNYEKEKDFSHQSHLSNQTVIVNTDEESDNQSNDENESEHQINNVHLDKIDVSAILSDLEWNFNNHLYLKKILYDIQKSKC